MPRQSRAERAADRAIKKQLIKLKKPRLRSECSQLGFDKDEWKKLKKDELITYLVAMKITEIPPPPPPIQHAVREEQKDIDPESDNENELEDARTVSPFDFSQQPLDVPIVMHTEICIPYVAMLIGEDRVMHLIQCCSNHDRSKVCDFRFISDVYWVRGHAPSAGAAPGIWILPIG